MLINLGMSLSKPAKRGGGEREGGGNYPNYKGIEECSSCITWSKLKYVVDSDQQLSHPQLSQIY